MGAYKTKNTYFPFFSSYECLCKPEYYGKNCQIPHTNLCPADGINYLEIEGRCFYLETQHLPFLKAKANCARNKFSTGGRLFEPMTLAENDKICDILGNLLGNIFFIPQCLLFYRTWVRKYFWTPTGFKLGTSRNMGPACYQNTN